MEIKGGETMRIEPLAMTKLRGPPPRRGVLRAAGAGAIAAVLGGRLGLLAGAQASFPTRIRVLHAAPELGKVEVFFNGEKKLDEFDYGTTSDWIQVDPGVVRATVRRDRA